MKLNYVLSKMALEDLDSIWLYTARHWSKIQANNYYKDIFKEVETICLNPGIGKSIHSIKPKHRLRSIKSHLIVYKVLEDVIYIDRVLHKRMDIDNVIL